MLTLQEKEKTDYRHLELAALLEQLVQLVDNGSHILDRVPNPNICIPTDNSILSSDDKPSEILLKLSWQGSCYSLIRTALPEANVDAAVDTTHVAIGYEQEKIEKENREDNEEKEFQEVKDEIHLSPREQEIVRLVAKGYPNKTIAAILEISPWTVSTHLRRVFAKLSVSARAEMVACAINLGLVQYEEISKE